jgi:hypothetical protein
MTRTRTSTTADHMFAKVATEGGQGGSPNVVIGRTGTGERDPRLVEVLSTADAPGLLGPGVGSATLRLSAEEANR